jgi:phytoene dehydrogenase-like protein
MTFDFVVVGGGMATRLHEHPCCLRESFNVCLLERQSQVGGCVARVQFGQHEFEPGLGMYSGWGEGEIHLRIFSELPVAAPVVSAIDAELVVRLADRTDVRIFKDDSRFFAELHRAFPECGEKAVSFYENVKRRNPCRRKSFLAKQLARFDQKSRSDPLMKSRTILLLDSKVFSTRSFEGYYQR